jgi:UDP-N-acetylglucosamine 2-epimerase (non-hydrolysing)
MPRLVHVVGARPNFIKAAPVIAALRDAGVDQRLVHTGQHYDRSLSDVFFEELGLPEPDLNLGVGSGSHAAQTAALLKTLEETFEDLAPDGVVVYGDVNSTLAAALVCAKLLVPVAHVEAGLRSFDPTMPEEVNRRVTDLLSDPLFVTAPEGELNLVAEGIRGERVVYVGNPMIDTLLAHLDRLDPAPITARFGLTAPYAVATLHRPANVDTADAAGGLVEALRTVARRLPIVLPLHPRGRRTLAAAGLREVPGLTVIDPLGYVDFLSLVRGASAVITDSGGIQEETTILDVPCLTLRPNTERPITISAGTNRLVTPGALPDALDAALAGAQSRPAEGPPGWDGHAGERIAAVLARRWAGPAPIETAGDDLVTGRAAAR